MNAKQTSTLLRRFVEHQKYFSPLPTDDGQWAIQNPKDAAAICVAAIKSRDMRDRKVKKSGKSKHCPLILVPVVPAPASGSFSVSDTFLLPKEKCPVKFAYIDPEFNDSFGGITYESRSTAALRAFRLPQDMTGQEIVDDLGGEEAAESTLDALWQKLLAQPNGQKGELLTNGYANLFLIRDRKGALRVVGVLWYGVGWGVVVNGLGLRWHVGSRFFSRNS